MESLDIRNALGATRGNLNYSNRLLYNGTDRIPCPMISEPHGIT